MDRTDPKLEVDTFVASGARARTMAALFGTSDTARAQPDRVGRYRILSVLGRGGMGVVYLAHDDELDRPVALKLIAPQRRADPESAAALRREAQQLAKVDHPNVVKVFEVGRHRGRAFLVMEFVEGQTLGRWVERAGRKQREIVEAFLAAGRGLAAAHRAGVLHRDFKPANVLVTPAGVPKVADFGLARISSADEFAESIEESATTSLSGTQIAVSGTKGTPCYMAPEQFRATASEASDQFAFGVAFLEALGGRHPFDGAMSFTLTSSTASERLARPTPRRFSSGLKAVLRRAVALAPEHRWPNMEALLEQVEAYPRRSRRRFLAAIALVGGAGIATVVSAVPRDETVCGSRGSGLAGVWDAARRVELDHAFTGASGPEHGAGYLADQFDAYAASWASTRADACTRAGSGADEAKIADLQFACLDRHKVTFDAAIDAVVQAPSRAARDPAAVVGTLSSLDECADVERLRLGAVPLRPDVAQTVGELRGLLAEATVAIRQGEYETGENILRGALGRVEATKYSPLIAELELQLGFLAAQQQRTSQAEPHLARAFFVADQAGHDAIAAAAASEMVFLTGYQEQRPPDVTEYWIRQAEASLDRAGTRRPASFLQALAAVEQRRGNYEASLALLDEAMNAPTATGPIGRAALLNNQAVLLRTLGRHEEAEEKLNESLELHRALLGTEHPLTLSAEVRLANVLRLRSRLEEAAALATHAALGLGGSGSQTELEACSAVGLAQSGLRNLADACPRLQQCVELSDTLYGAKSFETAIHLVNVASCLEQTENVASAEAPLRKALAIFSEAGAIEEYAAAMGLSEVLRAKARQEDAEAADTTREEALQLVSRAAFVVQSRRGNDSPMLAAPLTNQGSLLLEMGRGEEAVEPLRRSLQLRHAAGQAGSLIAMAELLLALAEWNASVDQPANAARAIAALSLLQGADAPVPAWLATAVEALR